MIATLAATTQAALRRYTRSWGLWAVLLIGPIAARWWIPRDDATTAVIAIDGHAPILSSAMLGVTLGVVVSTLLLPVGFIYLRSNVTRRQPWQVDSVTPASRVGIALGQFFADALVFAGVLAGLSCAGLIIGALLLSPHAFRPIEILGPLWLIAGPSLLVVAGVRTLFAARPRLRGALGEVAFFCLWMASLVMAIGAGEGGQTDFRHNMADMAGFLRPLTAELNPGDPVNLSIGSSVLVGAERIAIDPVVGITSPGYVASRLGWAGIALVLAALGGLVYRSPVRGQSVVRPGRFARWNRPAPTRPADPDAPAARRVAMALPGLLRSEAGLIVRGRMARVAVAVIAVAGLLVDFRHVASPAILLLLIFGATAHAGRSEQAKLIALTATMRVSPWARRAAFVLATTGWSVAAGLPAIARGLTMGLVEPLWLSLGTGAVVGAVTMALARVSRSAFAPRLVLLLAWYGYISV
ncbi:hypothetical protein ABS767_14365 [Sphingomonas sp. ST-64]|uniref:ABC-2 type transport system permease protein n=1 Tax=Sphingomonas plantiphila TaxID=3163295 RepID=A0ABW8YRT4_9SPHN